MSSKTEDKIREEASVLGKTMNLSLYDEIIVYGRGSKIYNLKGQEFIDLLSGASVSVLGYGNKILASTYYESCMKVHHVCVPYNLNPEAVLLAKKLCQITPGAFEKSIIFGLSGSDAIDGAIKAAQKYTKKRGVISFKNSYHGATGIAFQATNWGKVKKG